MITVTIGILQKETGEPPRPPEIPYDDTASGHLLADSWADVSAPLYRANLDDP
ncbi:MAG: hypothetical protein ACC628_16990 [Pirellulaceae bacterium]